MRAPLILLLLLAPACVRDGAPPREPGRSREPDSGPAKAKPGGPGPKKETVLPAGFKVVGEPAAEPAFLAPEATWRFLVSRLTTLRAEARGRDSDILVTFEKSAFHATSRAGGRRTWRLPEGLTLLGVPAHVQLRPDLTVVAFGRDGSQRPRGPEVTVVRARLRRAGGSVEEFRLIVKGGRAFRSISTAG